MVDNVSITAGAGTSVATDDIAGVHYQRVKVAHGADGSATDSSTAAPFPVQLRTSAGVEISPTDSSPVHSPPRIVTLTPSIDATALAAGDVVFDTEVLANVVRANDALGWLTSVTCIDEGDQKVEITLVLFSANVSLGTENLAPSITDANAANILGFVTFGSGAWSASNTSGWRDLGGVSIASAQNLNIPIKPATGTDDIYVAGYTGGAPTFGATTAIKLTFGFAD